MRFAILVFLFLFTIISYCNIERNDKSIHLTNHTLCLFIVFPLLFETFCQAFFNNFFTKFFSSETNFKYTG